MRHSGTTEVLHNLVRKHKDPTHPVRIGCVGYPGLISGVAGGGKAIALEKYADAFALLAGSSSGSAATTFLSAKQTRMGTSIYFEECTQGEFISYRRFATGGPLVSIKYLGAVFNGLTGKALDQSAVRASKADVIVAVTNAQTGEGEYLDVKLPWFDVVECLMASCAMPSPMSEGIVTVGGQEYLDGCGGCPFMLHDLVSRYNLTDVIMLGNRPERVSVGTAEKLFLKRALRKTPTAVREAFLSRYERFDDEWADFQKSPPCRYLALWTDDDGVSFLEQKPKVIYAAAQSAEAYLTQLLTEAQTRV